MVEHHHGDANPIGSAGGTVATWFKVARVLGVSSAEFFGTLD